MAITVPSARAIPHPCVAQRHTRAWSHDGDRSRAITSAAPLSCRHSSTSHRVLRSVPDAGGQLLGPPDCDLDVLRGQVLHHSLMHLLQVSPFFSRIAN